MDQRKERIWGWTFQKQVWTVHRGGMNCPPQSPGQWGTEGPRAQPPVSHLPMYPLNTLKPPASRISKESIYPREMKTYVHTTIYM